MQHPSKMQMRKIVVFLFAAPLFFLLTIFLYLSISNGYIKVSAGNPLSWCAVLLLIAMWLILAVFVFLESIASFFKIKLAKEKRKENEMLFLFFQSLGSVAATMIIVFLLFLLKSMLHWDENSFLVRSQFDNAFSLALFYYTTLLGISAFYPDK